jgi:hypothetical protein
MAIQGLTLMNVAVAGPNQRPAAIALASGLNVIVGASDTGKTYIFELIDFLLGATKVPEAIPEARGFDHATLEIAPRNEEPFRIKRALVGGEFELTTRLSDPASMTTVVLNARHSAGNEATLSGYLLARIGLGDKFVSTDNHGTKSSLSFRDVSRLVLVNEERIIQRRSPILTGEKLTAIRERNVFAYFLTGTDDSQVVPTEKPKDRRARLKAQQAMIESLLDEKKAELQKLSSVPDDLLAQAQKLDATIEHETDTVVASQQAIESEEKARQSLFSEQSDELARLKFLDEQLTRLGLLADFYNSDRARLAAVIEASKTLHEMPAGTCPLCGQTLDGKTLAGGPQRGHEELEAACRSEIGKIDVLANDLAGAIGEFKDERDSRQKGADSRKAEINACNRRIEELLLPKMKTAKTSIQQMLAQRARIAEALSLHQTTKDFEGRLQSIQTDLKQKRQKTVLANRTTTSAATRLCEIVHETLRGWKYPNLGPVAFDSEKLDLVIGGQDRQSKGKGYRALTHAAFTISLMRYCRTESIPHPGFVVLDTPLNPFKGPTTGEDAIKVNDEVKQAFFEELAKDKSGDQVIVMENEEPPPALRTEIQYHHFSKNPTVGRYGFYPHLSET